VKTLSPCDAYTDNQTGEPNAAVNARQKRVNLDYHAKARRLDEHYGCDESQGFKARLNSFGHNGVVLGQVIGAFGEMSDDAKHIADAVATELANEHCSYYSDKKKQDGTVLLPQPAVPILGPDSPPRMGTSPTRPPVPGEHL